MKKKLCAALAALLLLTLLPARAAEVSNTKILGTSGTVTVALRTTGQAKELVYTTDGVNWQAGETPADFPGAYRGYYSGGKFWLCPGLLDRPNYCSADGIHWAQVGAEEEVVGFPMGMSDLGEYHFELDGQGALWLSRKDDSGLCAELPDIREAQRRTSASYGLVQAYHTPGDTVTVEVYDTWDLDGANKLVVSYPTSSLDWVLEHQAEYYPMELKQTATNGSLTLGVRSVGQQTWGNSGVVYSRDGVHYTQLEPVPWGNRCTLLPYNGKTFVVLDQDSRVPYVSEDGGTWRSLRGTYLCPDLPEEVNPTVTGLSCWIKWTGSEYITCQRISEGQYGIMGSWGGWWYDPISTRVCFADENFNLTDEYDFGRQVLGAGYYGGAWYAIVSDSEGVSTLEYDRDAPAHLYTSTDKQTWTKTDYLQIMDALQSWA